VRVGSYDRRYSTDSPTASIIITKQSLSDCFADFRYRIGQPGDGSKAEALSSSHIHASQDIPHAAYAISYGERSDQSCADASGAAAKSEIALAEEVIPVTEADTPSERGLAGLRL